MNDEPRKPEDQFRNISDSVTGAFSSFTKKVGGFMDDFFREEADGEVKVKVDAYYTPDLFVIEAELPGVLKEDVSLQVVDQFLSLKGVKRIQDNAEHYEYIGRERVYGHFIRSLELPADIDLAQIKAKYDHGVLRVTFARLGVTPEDQGKQVDID